MWIRPCASPYPGAWSYKNPPARKKMPEFNTGSYGMEINSIKEICLFLSLARQIQNISRIILSNEKKKKKKYLMRHITFLKAPASGGSGNTPSDAWESTYLFINILMGRPLCMGNSYRLHVFRLFT